MVFTDAMEEFANRLLSLADSCYGLSMDKTLELAYEYAIQNGIVVYLQQRTCW